MPPDQTLRERFDGHELAIVLSYYDLGALESLRVFPRGSRRSPKVRIKSQLGEFLLKRRAAGHDDPYRVAFAHELQLLLAQCGYPVPGLIGTRDNNSMLHINGRTYEVFNYVHGTRFDHSVAHAHEVGAMLGRLHLHLSNHRPQYQAPSASFHGVTEIDAKMALLSPAILSVEPHTDRAKVAATVDFLRRAYHEASQQINRLHFFSWPPAIIHGDWHPGNLLFRHGQIVGVLDFDSARVEPRVVDVANGALQFSMLMGDPDRPSTWPDGLDEKVIRAVLAAYDQNSGKRLSTLERASLPWLMIEALIIESIVPIAATGSFARIPGAAFLQMIERKVKWIRPHAELLMESRKE